MIEIKNHDMVRLFFCFSVSGKKKKKDESVINVKEMEALSKRAREKLPDLQKFSAKIKKDFEAQDGAKCKDKKTNPFVKDACKSLDDELKDLQKFCGEIAKHLPAVERFVKVMKDDEKLAKQGNIIRIAGLANAAMSKKKDSL